MYRWILLLMLGACASQPGNTPELLYEQAWEVADPTATTRFTIRNTGKVEGSDGCNRIFGQVTVGKRLDFTKVASTRMACQHNNDRAFWDALQKHDSWRIRNDELQLLQGIKVIFRFQKAALAADQLNPEAEE